MIARDEELMKMETAYHHQDEKMRVLYEASYKGCVSTLNTLIQQDPLVLRRINARTIFIDTPLHISALLGHLEFTKALLTHKRDLARELDSFKSTALHLASAEGHIHIVKELLIAFDEAYLVRDQDGRIPLHYAVIRGRLEVVTELIRVKPDSLRFLDHGKTIFHFCVIYNHLEILKALVELNIDETFELLNLRDLDGKSVLDSAIMLKQVETIRYLLSIPKIREAACLENEMGSTDHMKDFKSLQIQLMLMNADIKSTEKSQVKSPPQPPPSKTTQEKGWIKILEIMAHILKHNNSNWFEEMRGNLSLVATVISTITFQAVINPPGGFVQQGNLSSENDPFVCWNFMDDENRTENACPGDAISAIQYPAYFHPYLKYNTIAFIASLAVVLILVSGIPLKHKAVMWMLSIGMCITLTFLSLTYLNGLFMVTPDGPLFRSAMKMFRVSLWSWIGFLGVVGVFITLRFLFWLVKKFKKKLKYQKLFRPRLGNENI